MGRHLDSEIVTALNEVLTAELTAINQYFLHAKMYANWGYARLAAKVRHESIDEMKHADELIERILFLGGLPNVQRLGKVNIGEDPQEMLELDLKLEHDALPRLNTAIALCRDRADNGTRHLLESILVSEEEHVDWIEAQLEQIGHIGLPGWLAEQLKE